MQCMLSYAGTARLKVQPASWVQCSSEKLWQTASLGSARKPSSQSPMGVKDPGATFSGKNCYYFFKPGS